MTTASSPPPAAQPSTAPQEREQSYLDLPALLDPAFRPTTHANALVTATNDPTDTPLDLTTPLSRALFDIQDLDTRLHTLTTTSAVPILDYTAARDGSAQRILGEVEGQVEKLEEGYRRLEREVVGRWEEAEAVKRRAKRCLGTVRVLAVVNRVVQAGRQVEVLEREGRDVRTAGAVVAFKGVVVAGREEGVEKVRAVAEVEAKVVRPAEERLRERARGAVREFSMSGLLAGSTGGATFAQAEEARSRTTSAVAVLYLLSPTDGVRSAEGFQPQLLLGALQAYLQAALTASVAAVARALGTLPTLDRTLLEVSARCQNIVALEALLENVRPPAHPLLPAPTTATGEKSGNGAAAPSNLLQPLLTSLDTSSLPSYFWRSLASSLSPRVQDIMSRGGVSARTLRTNREKVRDAIRESVLRGSQVPSSSLSKGNGTQAPRANWEREAAVMVGSVMGPLGR